jgi:hypothetical protein
VYTIFISSYRLGLMAIVRYNGHVTSPPPVFPPEMEEACQLVENVVNEALRHRSRYSLEWGGVGAGGQVWKANVAASNCYAGKFPLSIILLFFKPCDRWKGRRWFSF